MSAGSGMSRKDREEANRHSAIDAGAHALQAYDESLDNDDACEMSALVFDAARAEIARRTDTGAEVDQTKFWTFGYRNHRGEHAVRQAVPLGVRYGSTEWHPQPQWLLRAFDIAKQAEREFAMDDIRCEAISANRAPPPPAAADRGVPGQRVSDEEIALEIRLQDDDPAPADSAKSRDVWRDLRDCRAALAMAPKAEDVRREAIEECARLVEAAVWPVTCEVAGLQALTPKDMAKAIRALADRPAR